MIVSVVLEGIAGDEAPFWVPNIGTATDVATDEAVRAWYGIVRGDRARVSGPEDGLVRWSVYDHDEGVDPECSGGACRAPRVAYGWYDGAQGFGVAVYDQDGKVLDASDQCVLPG